LVTLLSSIIVFLCAHGVFGLFINFPILVSMEIQGKNHGFMLFSIWCGVFTYFDGVAFRVLECESLDVKLFSLMNLLPIDLYTDILEVSEPGFRVTDNNLQSNRFYGVRLVGASFPVHQAHVATFTEPVDLHPLPVQHEFESKGLPIKTRCCLKVIVVKENLLVDPILGSILLYSIWVLQDLVLKLSS